MFQQNFYHGLIRKYVVAFGTLFNDITIVRRDASENGVKLVKVPISYGPKEKFLVRLRRDPNLDQNVAIDTPRIGFNLESLTYSAERKLNKVRKNVATLAANNEVLTSQFVPIPYDLDFSLSIFVRNAEDGTRILEQILPYFSPEFNVSVSTIDELSLIDDIPIALNSVTSQEEFEGNFDQRRSILWNLSFTMRALIYGPVDTDAKVIRSANVQTYSSTSLDSEIESSVSTTPTLEGKTVDEINADDDFGFSTTIS